MANLRNLIPLFCLTAFLILGCSKEEKNLERTGDKNNTVPSRVLPDLSIVVEKRIEGKSNEAINILRKYNSDFPDSHAILLQLARSLSESNQFALAAFRFDQAVAAGAEQKAIKEAAETYALAGDLNSAAERYADYLLIDDSDAQSWVKYGRVLSKINKSTEAINALSKGSDLLSFEDNILLGDLLISKKLLPQAEYWYKTANAKNPKSPEPLLSLLKIKLDAKQDEEAESLILQIEEISSGTIEKTDLAIPSASLLRNRNLGEFISKGIAPSTLSVTELVKSIKEDQTSEKQNVISAGTKLPPARPSNENTPNTQNNPSFDSNSVADEMQPVINLADAFSKPAQENTSSPLKSNIEIARFAYLDRRYQETLFSARSAIKENPKNAEAWKLCSQAHFQLGETQEAEMTILEAIRHDPTNFNIRMDYLRIARETLSSNRYLAELEKARELFPESSDIVWELARRYHLVERMPVTAGVLYRKVLELEPSGSPLSRQAEMELLKLRE